MWVFLTELGNPDWQPTHRALLRAASTPLHIFPLSSDSAGMEPTRATAQGLPCDSHAVSRRSLPGLSSAGGGEVLWWTMENTHLSHTGKGNFYPQHRQEKAAPRDKNWGSSGAKATCQRQLLSVNKYSAKDKASLLLHLLEFCDEWVSRSAFLPGSQGLQECLHLRNFVSWVHNYPTYTRHSKVGFFFLLKKN